MADIVNIIFGVILLVILKAVVASFFGWATLPAYDFDTEKLTYKTFAGLTENDDFDLRDRDFSEPLTCIEIFQPVCGVDGNTYSNSCFAGDVEIAHQGQC